MKKAVLREYLKNRETKYIRIIGEAPTITAYDAKKPIEKDIEETRLKSRKVRKSKGDK